MRRLSKKFSNFFICFSIFTKIDSQREFLDQSPSRYSKLNSNEKYFFCEILLEETKQYLNLIDAILFSSTTKAHIYNHQNSSMLFSDRSKNPSQLSSTISATLISSSSSSPSASLMSHRRKNAPEFLSEMSNQTIALGRDATFECSVDHLGSYKVGDDILFIFCTRKELIFISNI